MLHTLRSSAPWLENLDQQYFDDFPYETSIFRCSHEFPIFSYNFCMIFLQFSSIFQMCSLILAPATHLPPHAPGPQSAPAAAARTAAAAAPTARATRRWPSGAAAPRAGPPQCSWSRSTWGSHEAPKVGLSWDMTDIYQHYIYTHIIYI